MGITTTTTGGALQGWGDVGGGGWGTTGFAGQGYAPGGAVGGNLGGGGWSWGNYLEGGLAGLKAEAQYPIIIAQLKGRYPGLSNDAYNFLAALDTDPSGSFVFDSNGVPISLDWLAQNLHNMPGITPGTLSRWAKESGNPMAQFIDPTTGRKGSKIAVRGEAGEKTGETAYQGWSSIPGHITFYYQAQKGGAERGAPSGETDIYAPTAEGGIDPRGWTMKSKEQIEEEERAKRMPSPRTAWTLAPSQRRQPAVSRYTPPTRWLVF